MHFWTLSISIFKVLLVLTSLHPSGLNSVGASSRMNQHGLPSRQHAAMGSSRVARGATPHGYHPVSYREQNTIFYTHHNMVGYNCSGIELLKELAFVTHIFGHSLIGPERNAS